MRRRFGAVWRAVWARRRAIGMVAVGVLAAVVMAAAVSVLVLRGPVEWWLGGRSLLAGLDAKDRAEHHSHRGGPDRGFAQGANTDDVQGEEPHTRGATADGARRCSACRTAGAPGGATARRDRLPAAGFVGQRG
jgi:hypothetical protein